MIAINKINAGVLITAVTLIASVFALLIRIDQKQIEVYDRWEKYYAEVDRHKGQHDGIREEIKQVWIEISKRRCPKLVTPIKG